YGAMDGASKFVKGDAVAAVIIVAINLLGGMAVGILQHHFSFSQSIHTFSILTIGDGLAAQIPALLVSTATGIVVTRSASETDLGTELTLEMLKQPRAMSLAGGLVVAMGLVPGLPKLPFFMVGGLLLVLARKLRGSQKAEAAKELEK